MRDRIRTVRTYFMPIVLVVAALLVVAYGFRPIEPRIWATAPLDLRAGVTHTIEFTAEVDGEAEIGVEMDQATAKRLFPCTADVPLDFNTVCPAATRALWPIALSFGLSSGGRGLSEGIEPSTSQAGGEYVGNTSFIWTAAFAPVSKGRRYELRVHTLKDGGALQSAQPRLIVQNADAGVWEARVVEAYLLCLPLAVLLTLGAAISALWTWRRRRKHPPAGVATRPPHAAS